MFFVIIDLWVITFSARCRVMGEYHNLGHAHGSTSCFDPEEKQKTQT